MEEFAKYASHGAFSKVLNNSGGPNSRTRSEHVKESLLHGKGIANEIGCYYIDLPVHIHDIEKWLLMKAEEIDWKGWQEINAHISLPGEKLTVLPLNGTILRSCESTEEILKAALILSMSNQYCYLPDGPRIFTRSRLVRRIRLLKINIGHFYELE